MNAANGPQTAFLVGSTRVGDTGIGLEQHLTAALVDHRGVVEMPAYAVMAESVTSGAYWYTFDEPVATVQSWLALPAGVAVPTALYATNWIVYFGGQCLITLFPAALAAEDRVYSVAVP